MSAFKSFAVVDLGAAQILQAHGIDQQFDAEVLDQGVAVLNLLVELESVLHARATAALHEYAQHEIGVALVLDERTHLACCCVGEDERRPYSSEVFTVPEGTEQVYVVYMIYSTGDSFGHSTGNIDIIHVTAREDAAHALAEKITKNPDEYSIEFVDDFARPIKISNRGAGYFERIDYVAVDCYSISSQGKKSRYYVN